jgi:hypothetical protein
MEEEALWPMANGGGKATKVDGDAQRGRTERWLMEEEALWRGHAHDHGQEERRHRGVWDRVID